MGSSKNGSWIIPFKKFSMLRVNRIKNIVFCKSNIHHYQAKGLCNKYFLGLFFYQNIFLGTIYFFFIYIILCAIYPSTFFVIHSSQSHCLSDRILYIRYGILCSIYGKKLIFSLSVLKKKQSFCDCQIVLVKKRLCSPLLKKY